MKISKILSVFLFVFSAPVFSTINLKTLNHDLVLKAGPKDKCDSESVRFLAQKNVLILGGNLSFPFEKSVTEASESGQCQYKDDIKISERELISQSTRSSCPKKDENGTLTEQVKVVIEKNQSLLIYQNRFQEKSFECIYLIQEIENAGKK